MANLKFKIYGFLYQSRQAINSLVCGYTVVSCFFMVSVFNENLYENFSNKTNVGAIRILAKPNDDDNCLSVNFFVILIFFRFNTAVIEDIPYAVFLRDILF